MIFSANTDFFRLKMIFRPNIWPKKFGQKKSLTEKRFGQKFTRSLNPNLKILQVKIKKKLCWNLGLIC